MQPQCPVTVNISREILKGNETVYESWVHRGTQLICQFPGFLGMYLKRPDHSTNNCYQLSYSFDTLEHQAIWKKSSQRSHHMKKLTDMFLAKETSVQEHMPLPTGISKPNRIPNPHKMTLVLIAVVFSVLFPLNALFGHYIAQLPLALRIFAVVLPQVLLMNYVIMPPLMRWLNPWLTR
ncbi:MAG: hypothetical protein V7750_00060 [Sneathiella sp.]